MPEGVFVGGAAWPVAVGVLLGVEDGVLLGVDEGVDDGVLLCGVLLGVEDGVPEGVPDRVLLGVCEGVVLPELGGAWWVGGGEGLPPVEPPSEVPLPVVP